MLALTFVPAWSVTNKMIEKLDDDVFTDDDIILRLYGLWNC